MPLHGRHASCKNVWIAFLGVASVVGAGEKHAATADWLTLPAKHRLPCLVGALVPASSGHHRSLLLTSTSQVTSETDTAAESDRQLDELLELSPEQLSGLRVTPQSATAKAVMHSLSTTISSQQAAQTTGSTTELLSATPGVALRRLSALGFDSRIRGYNPDQIQSTVDGIPQLRTRPDIDASFSQIDPLLVRQLTVIDGPYTAEHGPGFGFLLAELAPIPQTRGFQTQSTSVMGFNTNGQQLNWRETFSVSDHEYGVIAGVGQRLGNDYQPGGRSIDYRIPASFTRSDVFVAARQTLEDRAYLEVSYVRQDLSNAELPGIVYDINQQGTDQLNVKLGLRHDRSEGDRLIVQAWRHQTSYNADSLREAKDRTFGQTLINEPYYPQTVFYGQGYTENLGARLLGVLGDTDDPLQWRSGVDFRRTEQRYREDVIYQGFAEPEYYFGYDVFGVPEAAQNDLGIFTTLHASMSDDWKVIIGGRFDWVTSAVNANDEIATSADVTPNGRFQPGETDPHHRLIMAFGSSLYDVNDWLTLGMGTSFAMRAPNAVELYADQPTVPVARFGNSAVFGNSELRAEKNMQVDVSATVHNEAWRVTGRAFASEIHDYIMATPGQWSLLDLTSGKVPGRWGRPIENFDVFGAFSPGLEPADTYAFFYNYANIDRATLAGAELMGEFRVSPRCTTLGSMSWTHGVNHAPIRVDDFTGERIALKSSEGLPGIYPLLGIVGVRWHDVNRSRFSLEVRVRLVDGQHFVAQSLGEPGTPGFTTVSLYGSYHVTPRLTLRSSLLNLFDRNYTEHGSLAITDRTGAIGFVKEPGISWMNGLEYKF